MKVRLDPGLFALPAQDLEVLTLIGVAERAQHSLLSEPQSMEAWLATLGGSLTSSIELLLDKHRLAAANLPLRTFEITVEPRPTSEWSAARLNLEDAIRLLRTPLELLLENERGDWSFLRRLADSNQRALLDDALARGALQIRQGGGNTEVEKSVKSLLDASGSVDLVRARRFRRLRTWVMVDRDAHPEDARKPSDKANEIAQACGRQDPQDPWGLGSHQLPRRTIENFLPTSVLTDRHPDVEFQPGAFVAALENLRQTAPEVAACVNVKSGLLKDLPKSMRSKVSERAGNSDSVVRQQMEAMVSLTDWRTPFDSIAPQARADLLNGLGERIADLFEQAASSFDADFPAEYDRTATGPGDCAAALIDSILERI